MSGESGGTGSVQPQGEKFRKAVRWIGECLELYPERSRNDILREATIRFDLSPLECDFILEKLAGGEKR